MGAGASLSFQSVDAAISAGHTAEKVAAWMRKSDPWFDLTTQQQYQRIRLNEHTVETCTEDDLADEDGNNVTINLSYHGPAAQAYAINAADLDVETVQWRGPILTSLVALDLSGNQIVELSLRAAPHLRLLNLSGNTALTMQGGALTNVLQTTLLHQLLVLDLSFLNLGPSGGEMHWAKSMPVLREANLEDCELEKVPELPASLSRLNLSDNKLQTVASLRALNRLVLLDELDCRSNPVRDQSRRAYTEAVKGALPVLRVLDNAVLVAPCAGMSKPTCGRLAAFATVPGLQAAVGATDTVVDRMERAMFHEKCLCATGVPCHNQYACSNWTDRYAVAEVARHQPLPSSAY